MASIAHVERETARLSQLVERVLTFSAQGRIADDGARVPVDAAAEVRLVVEEFAPLALPRRVRVVTDLPRRSHSRPTRCATCSSTCSTTR